MDNHYHLLLETPLADLPQIMRHINGAYTTYFNVKRARIGHLFQGRYKAIRMQKGYGDFVMARVDRKYKSPLMKAAGTLVLGSAAFIQSIKERYLGDHKNSREINWVWLTRLVYRGSACLLAVCRTKRAANTTGKTTAFNHGWW